MNSGSYSIARLENGVEKFASEALKLEKVARVDDLKYVYFIVKNDADIAGSFYISSDLNLTTFIDTISFYIDSCWTYEVNMIDMAPFMSHDNIAVFNFKIVLISLANLYKINGQTTVYFKVGLKEPFTSSDAPNMNMHMIGSYYMNPQDILNNPEKYVGSSVDTEYYTTLDKVSNKFSGYISGKYVKHMHIYDPKKDIFSVSLLFERGQSYTFTIYDLIASTYKSKYPFRDNMFCIDNIYIGERMKLENIVMKTKTGESLDLSLYKVRLTCVLSHQYKDGIVQIR